MSFAPQKSTGIRHFYELDSLRGVAAATVVLSHFSIAYPRPWLIAMAARFPSRLLFDGHQAVVLFFVLSGFVLTLPMIRGKQPPFGIYLVKRMLRIYVPYVAALAIALFGDALFHGPARVGAGWRTDWVNHTWSAPINLSLILHHLLFLGNDLTQVNTAFWSLEFELRISLIFPFLAALVLALRARWILFFSIVLALTGQISGVFNSAWFLHENPLKHHWHQFVTFHYVAMFLLGALLAKNLSRVSEWCQRGRYWMWIFALPIAALLYDGYLPSRLKTSDLPHWLLHGASVPGWFVFGTEQCEASTTIGALLVIALALNLIPLRWFLDTAPIHHLGKVSYSLYLIHGTVLFVLIHLLPLSSPIALVFFLYIGCTLLLTEGFCRLIEIPAMQAGKSLGRRSLRDGVKLSA